MTISHTSEQGAAAAVGRRAAEVVFVCMPFALVEAPSLQLGLLKAHCAAAEIAVDVRYANLDLYAMLGPKMYRALAAAGPALVGEWIFTAAAFPEFVEAKGFPYAHSVAIRALCDYAGTSVDELIAIREIAIPEFVRMIAGQLAHYRIVCISSTFQQNLASLALARAIKERWPDITVVFGGANLEGEMGLELVRKIPWIDMAVSGEADGLIAPLLTSILSGGPPLRAKGLFAQAYLEETHEAERARYLGSMDDLPTPDFDAYFEHLTELRLSPDDFEFDISLPFESSRGCWWGQKHHCTFCGLNGGSMSYRPKSPERVGCELRELVLRYGITRMVAVDNIIPHKDLNKLCAQLASVRNATYFYEMKSNVTPQTVRMLYEAGIRSVQPGIENFSDRVLTLMRKGVSGLQNVNTLRWLTTLGVIPHWNFLYGFPGETLEDYLEQLPLIERLSHIPPPHTVGRIRIDRFSPYFEDATLRARFGAIRPNSSYAFLYPAEIDREKAAYFFDGTSGHVPTDEQLRPVLKVIDDWKEKWFDHEVGRPKADFPFLISRRVRPDAILVLDGRAQPSQPMAIHLDEYESMVYQTLDEPISIRSAHHRSDNSAWAGDADRFGNVIDRFDKLGLIATRGEMAVALAMPLEMDEFMMRRSVLAGGRNLVEYV